MGQATTIEPCSDALSAALASFAKGDVEGARHQLTALTRRPDVAQDMALLAHFQLGVMELNAGEAAQAVHHLTFVRTANPQHPSLSLPLGKALLLSGLPAEALPVLQTAAEEDPRAGPWLARAYLHSGDPKAAVVCFERHLSETQETAECLCDYGLALERSDTREKSLAIFDDVRKLFPTHYEMLLSNAEALRRVHNYPKASQIMQMAARLAPREAKTLHDLGLMLHELGLKDDAEAALSQSLSLQPTAAAYAQLATLHEKANEVSKAWATTTLALRLFPRDPHLHLIAARCERRAGKFADAQSRVLSIVQDMDDHPLRTQALYLLGWLYDDNDNPERAFAMFVEAKRRSALVACGAAVDPQASFSLIRKTAELGASGRFHLPSSPQEDRQRPPVFLVGFPRSGTTLLNQILDSHPRLMALEEQPVLPLTARRVSEWGLRYPEDVVALTPDQITLLRVEYMRLARQYVSCDDTTTLVDKLPLNIVHLPLMLTLFPNAKILFALRHPLSCVLSCFMHDFRLNNAMAHMMSLESIVDLYCKVMQLWLDWRHHHTFAAHTVRYEDVVASLEQEARQLCRFLDVPFAPEMLCYDQHARAKGLINTPSYHQVVQPLYRESVGRWQRYEKFLQPHMASLVPFVRAFGYES